MSPIAEVKSAKKRAISMGRYSGWRPEYDHHHLAACMDNYTAVLDAELGSESPVCYLVAFGCIEKMARRINAYCDGHKVVGDAAAQYWIERFLWRCDAVCQWDYLND